MFCNLKFVLGGKLVKEWYENGEWKKGGNLKVLKMVYFIFKCFSSVVVYIIMMWKVFFCYVI